MLNYKILTFSQFAEIIKLKKKICKTIFFP